MRRIGDIETLTLARLELVDRMLTSESTVEVGYSYSYRTCMAMTPRSKLMLAEQNPDLSFADNGTPNKLARRILCDIS